MELADGSLKIPEILSLIAQALGSALSLDEIASCAQVPDFPS